MKNKMVAVKRHTLLYRVLHWVIAAEIVLLLISGIGVSDYICATFISRGGARGFHIVLGLAWIGTITFFLYYFMMVGEYKWFGISRIGSAIDFFVHELKSFIEGKKVKSPISYSAEEKKYVEKIVLTEVLAWWGWFALWIIMVLTGLALLFPESLNFINRFCFALLPLSGRAVVATRFIHLVVSMVFIVYIIIHAYASWTFGMVGSIFSGTNEEPATND